MDCAMVWANDYPIMIKAVSERAKTLFMQWGVAPEADGIDPPDEPEHFIKSLPGNWIVGMVTEENPEKEFLVQEVPLPQPRIVLQ